VPASRLATIAPTSSAPHRSREAVAAAEAFPRDAGVADGIVRVGMAEVVDEAGYSLGVPVLLSDSRSSADMMPVAKRPCRVTWKISWVLPGSSTGAGSLSLDSVRGNHEVELWQCSK